jgi:hypothetical protein
MTQFSSLSGHQSSAFFLKFALPIAVLIHAGLLFLPRPPEPTSTPKPKSEAIEVDLAALPDIQPRPSPIAQPIVPTSPPIRPVPIQSPAAIVPTTANQSQQIQQAVAEAMQSQRSQRDRSSDSPQATPQAAANSKQVLAQPQNPNQPPTSQPSASPIVATGTDAFTQLGATSCGQGCFQLTSSQTFQDFEQVMTQRFKVKPKSICNEEGHRQGYIVQNAKQQAEYWYWEPLTGVGQTITNQYVQRSELIGQPCE